MSLERGAITQLLGELGRSTDPVEHERVLEELLPLIYTELKHLAHAQRLRLEGGRAPGTTSLVHEAYVKLDLESGANYPSRGHFYALAAKVMRSVLIDNARHFARQKRGSSIEPLPLDEARFVSARRGEELLALDQALGELARFEPELAGVVECRCFGGLTVDETAEALEISAATVKRRWVLATAWLSRELA